MEVARGRVTVIVGAGALRTDNARLLARGAAEAGADAVFVADVIPRPIQPLVSDDLISVAKALEALHNVDD